MGPREHNLPSICVTKISSSFRLYKKTIFGVRVLQNT